MSTEFGLEDGVKVLGAVDSGEAVAVGESREYTDFVGVFEGCTGGHFGVGLVDERGGCMARYGCDARFLQKDTAR